MPETSPVVFHNSAGDRLFGIYHPAAGLEKKSVSIILLSPGIKARVAPHRMYVRLAEQLSSNGWPVLRFDFSGLGDSEGELTDELHAGVHANIQVGKYVDDTLQALNWMSEHGAGPGGFVLGGLCGGAITGLLAARDTRVKGLLALGIPVMLDDPDVDTHAFVSAGQLKRLRHGYFKRMKDPDAWLRLLSFKTDFRMLVKSMLVKQTPSAGSVKKAGRDKQHSNRNPLFSTAMIEMMERQQPVCCVFGGNDRLSFEFEEQFLEPNRQVLNGFSELLSVHTVEHANHIFGWREWESEMLEYSKAWMYRWFGEVAE